MYIFDGERAGRLRRELAVKLNRDVPQQEIAGEVSKRLVARGSGRTVSDQVIRRLERGRVQRIDLEIVNELAAFYTEHGLDASKLLRYVPQGNGDGDKVSKGNQEPARIAA